jgi:hypothetical protein
MKEEHDEPMLENRPFDMLCIEYANDARLVIPYCEIANGNILACDMENGEHSVSIEISGAVDKYTSSIFVNEMQKQLGRGKITGMRIKLAENDNYQKIY